jgi:hypothetical protein
VPDGVVAVGSSSLIEGGDLTDLAGRGSYDSIIVKYNSNGDIGWKRNVGGSGEDHYEEVTVASGNIVAAGYSSQFGGGDLTGIKGRGGSDGLAVVHSMTAIPFFIDIVGVPERATVGKELTLEGRVISSVPAERVISWAVSDPGTTEASITGNVLLATAEGTVTVTATVENGTRDGMPYTKEIAIDVHPHQEEASGIPGDIWLWVIVAIVLVICIAAAGMVLLRKKNR